MKRNILIVAALATTLFACSGKHAEADMASNIAADVKSEVYEGLEESEDAISGNQENKKIDIPAKQLKNINRKLIKEGNITFETEDTKATKSLIEQAALNFNAYLSEDNEYDYGYSIQHNITLRIPSDNFDLLLKEISSSIKEIDDKNITVRDVTEEYVDVEARLKAKKIVENRYLELLSKAHTVGDILQVENELARLREQIESTEGRLRYLKDQVSLSTLRISFYEKKENTKGFGFGEKAKDGFQNGYKGLLWFFIGLINIWPFLLVLGVGVWWLVRVIKKSRRKKQV
jgi:hypothetical protein